jgi:hypothetical protein
MCSGGFCKGLLHELVVWQVQDFETAASILLKKRSMEIPSCVNGGSRGPQQLDVGNFLPRDVVACGARYIGQD